MSPVTSQSSSDAEVRNSSLRFRSLSLERLDILSKVAIGVATLVLSGVLGFATIYNNRNIAQLQIQNQIDAAAKQQLAVGGQLASTLLPVIMRGSPAERSVALKILSSAAPQQAELMGPLILASTKSPEAQEQFRQILETSATAKREGEFLERIQNAGKYEDFSLYAPACREYFQAFTHLPPSFRESVRKEFEDARAAYDSGRFAEAASKLRQLLRH